MTPNIEKIVEEVFEKYRAYVDANIQDEMCHSLFQSFLSYRAILLEECLAILTDEILMTQKAKAETNLTP